MRKNMLIEMITFCLLFGIVQVASAEVISFNIQGNITKVYDNEGYLNGSINEGDTFTGTLTYDTDVVNTSPYSGGLYEYNSNPNGISIILNNLIFQTDPSDVDFEIIVGDNGPMGDILWFTSSSSNSFPVTPTNSYERIEWFLSGPLENNINYDLPTSIDLSSWTWGDRFNIQSGENDSFTNPDYRIEGEITAISLEVINQPPIANAGVDQLVFDEIILDASLSDDSDGTIASFAWELQHRENPAYNKTEEGMNPTIVDLVPGFYDVILTVTDDDGESNNDTMMFGAIGLKGDLDIDGNVDGADLAEFSFNFGM